MAGPNQLIRTARRLTCLIGQNIHVCMYEGNIVHATTSSPGMVVSSLCYLKEDEYLQKGITLTQQYTAAFK